MYSYVIHVCVNSFILISSINDKILKYTNRYNYDCILAKKPYDRENGIYTLKCVYCIEFTLSVQHINSSEEADVTEIILRMSIVKTYEIIKNYICY